MEYHKKERLNMKKLNITYFNVTGQHKNSLKKIKILM